MIRRWFGIGFLVLGLTLLVAGQVRNDGATAASNVQVVASPYDAGGQIVNAAASTRARLAAGATARFQIAPAAQWQGYASDHLQVRGN